MNTLVKYFPLTSFLILCSGCASQPRDLDQGPGLLIGVWHGLIAIPSLTIGLFSDVRIYNFPNSGYWYDVGFAFGFFMSSIILLLAMFGDK